MDRQLKLHPDLEALLERLGVADGPPPDGPTWERLKEHMDDQYHQLERLDNEMSRIRRGWSSFENLFKISPVPMMEQDYSRVRTWMDHLRDDGVTDFREYLGEDIEAIRAIVPKITIVAANTAAVEAVGLPHDELIGPVDPVIVNEGSESGWLAQLQAVWNGDTFARASFVASTADGETYDAESTLSAPIVDGRPDFSRAVFSLIDITLHREEERRMAGLVEAKDQFLASVSHEIRTPLTAILGFARLLESDDELTEDDHKLMTSSIAEHAQDMSNLVEDLLVAARADIGQLDIVEVELDVMEQIGATIGAGGSFTTDVTVKSETGSSQAIGDPSRVRQILRNLLTNAERYGGPEVSIAIRTDGEFLFIDVADNGPGLPDGEWERIFEAYESAHVPTHQPSAVGIGLTISRQLAQLMGGTLQYSTGNGLSVFRLALRASRG